MNLAQYIDNINQRYKLGNATEHTFRGDLQTLLESLVPTIRATNEPKRQSCGAPDYILTKKDIPIGFIEAKDIGDKDLEGAKKTGNKEQFDRYKDSLSNLIFTDYLNFLLYRDGQFITKIAIAEITDKGIKPLTENFTSFENLIKDFCSHVGQTIKSSKKLAEMMAGKARLLSEVIEKALTSDEEKQEDSTLKDQMTAFRQILIHDITPKGFADVYAQTIAYGMFAARLHDPTLPTFSRQEAAELIPKSNPFLRKLFGYIAGPDIDDRIKWIVDSLVEIFLACNVEEILKNYGKSTKMEDPIIHFYETFLSEYDPKLRKARGVWYTPAPVVNFIVRAVDDILKTEFNLPQGLADNSKTRIKVDYQGKKIEQEVHKVQILDPATGTGTFLAEVVKLIHKKFEGQQGIWSNYVETHLLPRLNGFELLMASYAMAHLKLDLLLTETGYKPTKDQRFRVYLTNSLEESHPDTGTLFANWLSTEANEANHIKRDTPVMCVIGNPPYAVSSTNKNEWIQNLITDYKKGLNERKINLDDDYIKFIRYGQHFIDKNGSGILAYISNNSFIDGITHRQMRKNIVSSFDKIYIIDLHGNSSKKERDPNGGADENVFDIQQGVSINIFIKNKGIKKSIQHFDLFGKREFKYDFLNSNNLNSISWNSIKSDNENCFFTSKDLSTDKGYLKYISIADLMPLSNSGIQTKCDSISINESVDELKKTVTLFQNEPVEKLKTLFNREESSGWNFQNAKDDLIKNSSVVYAKYNYRPFDFRKIVYTGSSSGFLGRSRSIVMKHFINKSNVGICLMRQFFQDAPYSHIYATSSLIDERTMYSNRGGTYLFPLYIFPENKTQQTIGQTTERTPNLSTEIVKQIADKLGLTFVPEKNSPPSEGCPQGGVDHSINSILCLINNIPIKRNYIENLPCNQGLSQRAKEKRKAGILSEVLFWLQVHKGAFHKIDFDRQRIIGNYIVDFYVKALGLVVEIDGSSHDNKVEYDHKRQQYLEDLGLRVYRITDGDVKINLSIVMAEMERYIVDEYGEKATPVFDHPSNGGEFAPIDILDYIYAVLHSPTYREKYKEFLKIDFPRVPFPKDKDTFWHLVKLGGEIRQIHLLESPTVEKYITQYPIDGNNEVGKTRYQDGKVYINDTQYFDNVPQLAWDFYIGGYQPAQKWLKDRKERKLEFDDILHYQKIIVALTETDRLMKVIDKIEME